MTEPTGADLSRLVVLVPLAGLEEAKTRLGRPSTRRSVRPSSSACSTGPSGRPTGSRPSPRSSWSAPTRPCSGPRPPPGRPPLRQSDVGLNEGLRAATRWAVADGATAILALAGDLPGVTPDAVRSLIAAAARGQVAGRPLVAIVADRHGRGTNALLVSPPDAIGFAFGPGSRAAHRAAADAAGAAVVEPDGPLALDLDLPEDLILAEELGLLDPARVG